MGWLTDALTEFFCRPLTARQRNQRGRPQSDVGFLRALRELAKGKPATVRPRGGSMRGRIEDNQLVTLLPVTPEAVKTDDVVLVRWKRGHLLHLVKEVRGDKLLIGNNVGRINGWVERGAVLARVKED